MFKKILIANRGEIAIRVMRTAREMGVKTVAVYSEADRSSPHVLSADEAIFLGDSDPTSSYLNIEKIIRATKESESEAIHPGYGFLAENPDFAKQVVDEGLVFIGPPPEAMAKLGEKTAARRIMAKSNVPIIPGMTTLEPDLITFAKVAKEIGWPVLLKAASGGGGKGMRIVESEPELLEAAELGASEALRAFGNGAIYLEKYLDRPRHVEFQILADNHGNVVHLFERECSIQRRHQKIIEETPSPALTDELRLNMGLAATAAAGASGYVNAGTVEFLLDQQSNFYFLEVNTRLQVEHPITEMTTGIDLVRQQLEIAAGTPLSFSQADLTRKGHAIECRIYAEDPAADFMPAPGKIAFFKIPEGPGIRFDHAIRAGMDVPVEYDPILGKLIVWAEDRPAACARIIRALKETVILGVKTPIEFLLDILSSQEFQSGDTHTHFINEQFPSWRPDRTADEVAALAYIAKDVAVSKSLASAEMRLETEQSSPWRTLGAWDLDS